MQFDKWFNKQSVIIKAILLIIPVVSWVCEVLVRLSVLLRTKSTIHVIALIAFLVIGGIPVLAIADFIYMLVKGHLFLAE